MDHTLQLEQRKRIEFDSQAAQSLLQPSHKLEWQWDLQDFLDTCVTQQAIHHFLDGCCLQFSPPENAIRLFEVFD